MTVSGRFSVNYSRIRSKIGESVKGKAERITQKLVDSFVRDSPVFTGNFRASWNVSQGFPQYIVEKSGSKASPLGAPTFVVKAQSNFPVFFITNGQPYGKKLENGSSTQAPLGIIRVNIAGLR